MALTDANRATLKDLIDHHVDPSESVRDLYHEHQAQEGRIADLTAVVRELERRNAAIDDRWEAVRELIVEWRSTAIMMGIETLNTCATRLEELVPK